MITKTSFLRHKHILITFTHQNNTLDEIIEKRYEYALCISRHKRHNSLQVVHTSESLLNLSFFLDVDITLSILNRRIYLPSIFCASIYILSVTLSSQHNK